MLSTVGLGIVPVVLWVATLAFAAVRQRSWFRKPGLWLSSIGGVAIVVGVLSFFQPYDGPLGWFSVYGQNTLGGGVGDAIIGDATWVGALRLFGIFLVSVAAASPALAIDVGLLIGQGAVFVYLIAFMGVRGLIERRRAKSAQTVDPESEIEVPAELLTPYARTSYEQPEAAEAPEPTSGKFKLPEFSDFFGKSDEAAPEADEPEPVTTESTAAETAIAEEAVDDELIDEEEDGDDLFPIAPAIASPDSSPPALHPARKANRYWSTNDDECAKPGGPLAVTPKPVEYDPPANGAAPGVRLWEMPSMEILHDAPEGTITEEKLRETAETIVRTLGDYGVEVEIGNVRPGPTVTMYGLVPGWVRKHRQSRQTDENGRPVLDESGKQIVKRVETKTRVKVDTILAREKDLALALKTPSIRLETPAMGKSLVGIEVPNPSPSLVTLRGVMESPEFKKLKSKAHLPIALGKGSGGETVVLDLAKMPHLLIAGATGSGKSVCINAIVSCLAMEKSPADLRMLLIDPKRVELTPYNGIPHLMAPVIVETDQVVGYLKGMIREMLDRYRRMEEVGVRNIEAYNKRMPDKMPFLVVAIDELADLMMSAAFDVEASLCRLAQLGRATGIHLIIATQRPSVDVVTGLIKANFPSRISFGVTSQVDSRTILDVAGAEKLLGKGDMLYLPIDAGQPSRAQNVFISDTEIEALVGHWRSTPWPALQRIDLNAHAEDDQSDTIGGPGDDRDEMLGKAIELAYNHRKLSTSLLQRRLRIGYPRAARLMDQLEDEGIVGPGDGSKSRDVIITSG
ncbi:MAG: DNA translocase FtsK [SAR202 cluster bacterium]|nr:DNA translocase FtsK [SAR202 cluster bacterium]